MQNAPNPPSDLSSKNATTSPERGCWLWAGWEPDRFYLRAGAKETPYFGNGEWVCQWREALESEETIKRLANAGTTLLITRFYKGFGPALERQEWGTLKQYVQRAHAHGIKVWGYLQGQSLFGETLFNEYPDARDWIARKATGEPVRWAESYNRYAPCLTHPNFRAMMSSLLQEGLRDIGLDGIHLDNNYYRHCYCDRCKERFRQWLTERGDLEERTGIPVADSVEPPPIHLGSPFTPDPLAILWIEFGVAVRKEFMVSLRNEIHAVKPGATLSGNPAFMRNYNSRAAYALDPQYEGEVSDWMCIENGNQPRIVNGRIFTQADKHLLTAAAGLSTWVTSWRPGRFGASPPETASHVWAGVAEEFSFIRCSPGNNWALRPAGDGKQLLMESLKESWNTFGEAIRFFRGLEQHWNASDREQWGEVAFYFAPKAYTISPPDGDLAHAFLIAALEQHLPIRILFPGDPVPAETHTILIVQNRAIDAGELQRLSDPNREIWLIGPCGELNERAIRRNQSDSFDQLAGVRTISSATREWLPKDGDGGLYFKGQAPALSAKGKEESAAIFQRLKERLLVRIKSRHGVMSNIEKYSHSLFIHLRNLGDDPLVSEAKIHLPLKGKWTLECATPQSSKEWRTQGEGNLDVELPSFEYYAGIRITTTTLLS